MNAHSRTRGPAFVHANAGIVAELNNAFADFKRKHGGDLDELLAETDRINQALAALKIGGGAGTGFDDDGLPRNRRAAFHALGTFGRTGAAEALTKGLTVNAAMSRDSGPDGGYVVGEEIATEIMRVQRNASAMRRVARVALTSSASLKQPFSLNNAASGWVGERQARPETDGPDFALIDVPAGDVYANPAITQNLLDDSAYNLGEFIATEIGDAFTAQEGSAFISGNGVNKPRGLLTYDLVSTADAMRDFGKIQYFATGAASDFATVSTTVSQADILIDMVHGLKAGYRQRGVWLMNSSTQARVAKFKDAEGAFIYTRGMIEGAPDRLLGYPVEVDEDMPDIGAGTFPIAFGDFQRGYLITDRQGVRILRNPYTNKPYVMFYATKRVGGALMDSNAIKLLKVASS